MTPPEVRDRNGQRIDVAGFNVDVAGTRYILVGTADRVHELTLVSAAALAVQLVAAVTDAISGDQP